MDRTVLFRVTKDGIPTYGPYTTVAVARNVASHQHGGYWRGSNRQIVRKYSRNGNDRTMVSEFEIKIQIQQAVLKPLDSGSLMLAIEWVDYNGE